MIVRVTPEQFRNIMDWSNDPGMTPIHFLALMTDEFGECLVDDMKQAKNVMIKVDWTFHIKKELFRCCRP